MMAMVARAARLLVVAVTAAATAAHAAPAAPFHVVRSTRWPCVQFGQRCVPPASNAFAGALIMCNNTATDKDGRACCSAQHYADPLDAACYSSPARIRDALAAAPKGQRLIGTIDGESDMGGPTLAYSQWFDPLAGGFRGPWGDNATAFVRARWRRWMAEFKKIGGVVDVLHVDAEWHGWHISHGFAQQRSTTTNKTGIWAAVAADPRWPALQARLDAAGEPFGCHFSDISDMGTWALNATGDLRAHVWDAVMYERTAEIVNASYFEPVRESFPKVKCSNYGHIHTPPPDLWTFMSGTSEGHPPFVGKGAHVGTHQAKSFYIPAQGFAEQCAVTVGPSSRMDWCWSYGTPFWERKMVATPLDFAVLLWATTRIRGMVVANPHVPVSPWLAPKDSVTYPFPGGSFLANSEMYEEMVIHLALAGVSEFLFWHAGPPRCCFCGRLGACADGLPVDPASCPDPPSNRTDASPTVGVAALNPVLVELDEMVGAAGRNPLLLSAPQAWDPFVLSGVEMPTGWRQDQQQRQRVYRFTPRQASGVAIVSEMPATFRLPGSAGDVVPVPGGRLHHLAAAPASSAGFWIVASAEPAVNVAMKTDDMSAAPASADLTVSWAPDQLRRQRMMTTGHHVHGPPLPCAWFCAMVLGVILRLPPAASLLNGAALTPPLGWVSWMRYRCTVSCNDSASADCLNEKLVRDVADAMVSGGYKDAGYEYVNLDGAFPLC